MCCIVKVIHHNTYVNACMNISNILCRYNKTADEKTEDSMGNERFIRTSKFEEPFAKDWWHKLYNYNALLNNKLKVCISTLFVKKGSGEMSTTQIWVIIVPWGCGVEV